MQKLTFNATFLIVVLYTCTQRLFFCFFFSWIFPHFCLETKKAPAVFNFENGKCFTAPYFVFSVCLPAFPVFAHRLLRLSDNGHNKSDQPFAVDRLCCADHFRKTYLFMLLLYLLLSILQYDAPGKGRIAALLRKGLDRIPRSANRPSIARTLCAKSSDERDILFMLTLPAIRYL